MGGKNQTTSTQQQQSTSQPWLEAQPALKNILGQVGGIDTSLTPNQTGALDQTIALARAGNPYAPGIDSFVTTALAGGGPDRTGLVNDAYNNYKTNLEGTARGDYLDPSKNPFFANTTNAISNDVQNRVNSMFAGAGRDLSGANQGTLAREITNATAPLYANVYNTERGNQRSAWDALYGAGGNTATTLAGLDQQRFANQGAGVNAAYQADQAKYDPYNQILAAEAQRRGIPLSTLQQLAGIAGGIGGLGRSTEGTATGTQTVDQPFNPLALAPLAFVGGTGGFGSSLAGGLFNGIRGMFGSSSGPGMFGANPYANGWKPAPYA